MVWYENLNRTTPYRKNFRRWNLWYDANNPKHTEIKFIRLTFPTYFMRRMFKHEAFYKYFNVFCMIPLFLLILKAKKRYSKPTREEPDIFSGPQYVASIGRNQYGFETRASKSFEHLLSILLGREIFGHILSQDSDPFRAEEMTDDGQGLAGDLSEEDILDLRREKKHEPHIGIVYRHPHKHYLNESPNDLLSPYKVVGDNHTSKSIHH